MRALVAKGPKCITSELQHGTEVYEQTWVLIPKPSQELAWIKHI